MLFHVRQGLSSVEHLAFLKNILEVNEDWACQIEYVIKTMYHLCSMGEHLSVNYSVIGGTVVLQGLIVYVYSIKAFFDFRITLIIRSVRFEVI